MRYFILDSFPFYRSPFLISMPIFSFYFVWKLFLFLFIYIKKNRICRVSVPTKLLYHIIFFIKIVYFFNKLLKKSFKKDWIIKNSFYLYEMRFFSQEKLTSLMNVALSTGAGCYCCASLDVVECIFIYTFEWYDPKEYYSNAFDHLI